MAFSIQKDRGGPDWPLGCVVVPTIGTPVCIMANVDPSNNNAPWQATSYLGNTSEYSPICRGVSIAGWHPGSGNNGMVINTGNVYLMRKPAGGAGNRQDSGSMVAVIWPGSDYFFPPDGSGTTLFSPYNYYLDADANNEGGLVTLYGCGGM